MKKTYSFGCSSGCSNWLLHWFGYTQQQLTAKKSRLQQCSSLYRKERVLKRGTLYLLLISCCIAAIDQNQHKSTVILGKTDAATNLLQSCCNRLFTGDQPNDL